MKQADEHKSRGELLSELKVARSRIAELETAALSLRNIENIYNNIINDPLTGIVVWQDDKMIYINQSFVDILGYEMNQLLNHHLAELLSIIHPADRHMMIDYNEKRNSNEKGPFTYEFRCYKKTGELCWYEARMQLIENNNRPAYLSLYRNITELKTVEHELRESEARFRAITESALDSIFSKDKDRKYTYVNPAMEKLLGLPASEIIGKTPEELFGVESAEIIKEVDDIAFRGESVNEIKNLPIGDENFIFHTVQVPMYNDEGTIKEISGIVRDITEQKHAEITIRENMDQLKTLYAMSLNPILIVNEYGYYEDANNAALDFLECTKDELLKKQVWDFDHPDFHEQQKKEHTPFLASRTLETDYYINGTIKTLMLNVVPVQLQQRTLLYGVGLDITDRKRMEQILSEKEALFRELFDNINSAVAIYETPDNGDTFVFKDFNKAGQRIENITKEELIGKSVTEIFPGVKEFGLFAIFQEVYQTGKPHNHPISFYEDDRITGWRQNYVFKLHSGEIVAVYENLTEKKQQEEQILNSLREKEILLKEIHHRVKNNLQTISSLISLQTMYVQDQNVVSHLNNTSDRIKSMGIIHEKLYQNNNFSRIDFNDYINTIVDELYISHHIDHSLIQLNIQIAPVFFTIDTAIPCGLIINEIITNTLKYAFPDRTKGEISIKLYPDDNNETYHLLISDSGIGLPGHVSFSQNHGLGLQLIEMLTKQIHGEIEVNRDNGTHYHIIFKEIIKQMIR